MGIGDWGLGPIPNPQSPIPNPQSPFIYLFILYLIKIFCNQLLNLFIIIIENDKLLYERIEFNE